MSRRSAARLIHSQPYTCASCLLRHAVKTPQRQAFHTTRRTPQTQYSVLSRLEERGYVNQIAGDRSALDTLLSTRRVGVYAGIDPTAPSLHLGHLLPLMLLFCLYHHGHHAVSLVGGATAKVGDPSGRLTSRTATPEAVMQANSDAMQAQLGRLWENALRYGKRHGREEREGGERELLNNAHWLDSLNILHFVKVMGNGMRMGAMLGRETVRNKMEKGDGMSFAEFTYPLLQAWDWWQMYQGKRVQIQVGGSDQYGNIIAGIDAVKYIAQHHATAEERARWLDGEGRLKPEEAPMGITVPLLTTSSGEKFGKSAGNAVWLDRNLTSPFDLYGFLLRSADADVERYLKLFTFLPTASIAALMAAHHAEPGQRQAQHALAGEVLELVYGPEEAGTTRAQHLAMRAPTLAALGSAPDAHAAHEGAGGGEAPSSPTQRIRLPSSLVHGTPFARILYHAGLVASKSEGARLIAKGGVYVASSFSSSTSDEDLRFTPLTDPQASASSVKLATTGGLLVLRLGKWKVRVVEVVGDEKFVAAGLEAPGCAEVKAKR